MNAVAVPDIWPEEAQKLTLTGPSGAIEAVAAGGSTSPQRIAVICHPHSLHGGSMDNKVVTSVERCLRDLGAATLRFNFRGVGGSAGSFDHGQGEGEDLAAVVAQARAWAGDVPLWLAGFSFGSYVAARMADALAAELLISVAPPVGRFAFGGFKRPSCRWIVVQGDADEVVDPSEVFAWVEQLQPPVELIHFAKTGHFFHGKVVELRQRLTDQIQGRE